VSLLARIPIQANEDSIQASDVAHQRGCFPPHVCERGTTDFLACVKGIWLDFYAVALGRAGEMLSSVNGPINGANTFFNGAAFILREFFSRKCPHVL
jgi:hypothetical protein